MRPHNAQITHISCHSPQHPHARPQGRRHTQRREQYPTHPRTHPTRGAQAPNQRQTHTGIGRHRGLKPRIGAKGSPSQSGGGRNVSARPPVVPVLWGAVADFPHPLKGVGAALLCVGGAERTAGLRCCVGRSGRGCGRAGGALWDARVPRAGGWSPGAGERGVPRSGGGGGRGYG